MIRASLLRKPDTLHLVRVALQSVYTSHASLQRGAKTSPGRRFMSLQLRVLSRDKAYAFPKRSDWNLAKRGKSYGSCRASL